jgi:hypothetical protein
MKKFLVFPLWIFLGLLIPTVLGMLLPQFFNENIAIFGILIFILCIYMGFRNFNKIKSLELAKKLVDIYSYSESSVAAMSQQEITLRFDMHTNSSIDELHNLSYEDLKNKKSVAEKDRRKASHEKNVKELKESFEDVKVKANNLKNTYEVGAADVKKSFDELSKSKQDMVEAFSEVKRVWNEPSDFSVGFKKGADLFGSTNSSSNTVSDKKSDSLSSSFNSQNEVHRDQDRHIETTTSSSPIVNTPAKVDSFKAKNVVAISGAVITWYEDGMMKYYNKCEACAAVETHTEHYTQAPMPPYALDSSFLCYKCRHHNKLLIKAV